MNYGIPGLGVAYLLGMGYTYDQPLKIYAPKREGQLDMANPADGFVEDELFSPGVVFLLKQGKYDKNYILTSIHFTRRLFGQDGMVSSLEIRLKPGSDFDAVKSQMQELAQGKFLISDRYEQQDDTFRIMKIEKLIAYIFLTFILVIACFNIIGSLSMLIIDKKDDVVTLRNLGASGIAIGLLLCWIQQQYGLVRLGSSEGSFIVDAYPVSVHPMDIVIIFVTVLLVGFLAVWYPVRYFSRRLLS